VSGPRRISEGPRIDRAVSEAAARGVRARNVWVPHVRLVVARHTVRGRVVVRGPLRRPHGQRPRIDRTAAKAAVRLRLSHTVVQIITIATVMNNDFRSRYHDSSEHRFNCLSAHVTHI